MLQLKEIELYHFKNYENNKFSFNHKIVGICGHNGLGKTNLLDAIYYLCFTRSYFIKSDSSIIKHGSNNMRLYGNFLKKGIEEKITCVIREKNRKEVSRNGDEYKKFSAHIGEFPAVMISPDDLELINGTSEVRRKYLDTLLCQINNQYLENLIQYNKILQQRNSYLKSFDDNQKFDESLMDVLDKQLVSSGKLIFDVRQHFLNHFLPRVCSRYVQIAGSEEALALNYNSQLLKGDFADLIRQSRTKDKMLQRTNTGIHRDDIDLLWHQENFKNIASQGQKKSLLFALKLEECSSIKKEKGYGPILLLDDVFEKLDGNRIHNLLQQVCSDNLSQIFITDTDSNRLIQEINKISADYQSIVL